MMYDKQSRCLLSIIVAVISCIFLLMPSAYCSAFFEPVQTTKFIFLSCLVAIAMLLAMFRGLYLRPMEEFRLSVVDMALIALLVYVVVNRYWLQGQYGFSLRFLELLALSAVYIVLKTLPTNKYLYILLAAAGGALLQIVAGLLQLTGVWNSHHPDFRITGNFFNPGGYAGYLAMAGVLSMVLVLYKDQLSETPATNSHPPGMYRFTAFLLRSLPIAVIIGCVILLPALRSRAAWLSVALAAAFVWFSRERLLVRISFRSLLRNWYAWAFSGTLAGIGALLYYYKQHSADGRLLIYRVSADLVKEHPLSGVGFDRFKAYYMNGQANWFAQRGYDESDASRLADNTIYAFNEPLQFLVENGWLGVLIVLAGTWWYWRTGPGQLHPVLRNTGYALLLAYGVFGLFSYTSDNLAMKILMVLALAMLSKTAARPVYAINPSAMARSKLMAALVPAVVLAGTFYVVQAVVRLKNNYAMWGTAENAYAGGLYSKSNSSFTAALPAFGKNGEFLMQYGKSLMLSGHYDQALVMLKQAESYVNSTVLQSAIGDCEKHLKHYDEAGTAYKKAMYMVPNRFYPMYQLMKLYDETNQREQAILVARSISIKKVKVPSKAISEIKQYAKDLMDRSGAQ